MLQSACHSTRTFTLPLDCIDLALDLLSDFIKAIFESKPKQLQSQSQAQVIIIFNQPRTDGINEIITSKSETNNRVITDPLLTESKRL